jgi:hypothetical protein
MTSFRQIRNLLAIAFDAGYINEEEFLLLWDANMSKNPDFSVDIYPWFNLNEKSHRSES